MNRYAAGAIVGVFCCLMMQGSPLVAAPRPEVQGGIVVQIGLDDPGALADMAATGPYLVHGLDTDMKQVEAARTALIKRDVYGPVSVSRFDGKRLPYVDNLVNCIRVSGSSTISSEECRRALAPGGVLVKQGKVSFTKPWPDTIDDWNHFLHDPDNNAVAKDSQIGMPRSMQWVSEPRWGRSHEEFASMSAAVTANGRCFYIVDEAPNVSIRFMSDWKLVARDAFNGVLLWKQDVSQWNDHLRHFRSGPAHLPRRLVAVGDKVYVTLSLAGPVTMLDAATGTLLKTYKGTEYTEEILVVGDVMYLAVGTSEKKRQGGGLAARGEPEPVAFRYVAAVDVTTGKELWRQDYVGENCLLPLGLAVKDKRVYCQTVNAIYCLDAGTGKELWKTARIGPRKRMGYVAPTLVVTDEVLLSADRKAGKTPETGELAWGVHGWNVAGFARTGGSTLRAYAVKDGKELWSAPCAETYNSQVDVFVIQDLVWFSPGYQGYDLKTGKVVKNINTKGAKVGMPHHRCYRNKASSNFILQGKSGVELLSLEKGWVENNSWIRGTCQYGIMPSYGMIYAPPDACGCFLTVKAPGFIAVTPRRSLNRAPTARLEKGPEYGKAPGATTQVADRDWPMYRRDAMRRGVSPQKIADAPKQVWSVKPGGLSGRLTQPVVVGGSLYVAAVDRHTLYALDAKQGQERWSYTAGGRIDSSPTFHKGMILFGCADGRVYCLNAATGRLVWRFLAAPEESLVSAYGQLESRWPLHGAVLIQNGRLYVSAGRSSYMDDGFRFTCLDPVTGKELATGKLYHRDPTTDKQIPNESGFNMAGTTSEVLSGDGNLVYLKHFAFDQSWKPAKDNIKPHLFAITGLLGEEWFVRSYWTVSSTVDGAGWGGWANTHNRHPAGRILCFDDTHVYAYGRQWTQGGATGHKAETYGLFALLRQPEVKATPSGKKKRRGGGGSKGPRNSTVWFTQDSLVVRAMVVMTDKIAVAGSPNVAKKDPAVMAFANDAEAVSAYRGEKGAFLRMVSKVDGKQVSEIPLPSVPVLDGLSAAAGQLFIALKDGSVVCYQ